MFFIRLFTFFVLCSLSISGHCKVVLSNEQLSELINSIQFKTKIKDNSNSLDFTITRASETYEDCTEDAKSVQEITNNDIKSDVERNKTKKSCQNKQKSSASNTEAHEAEDLSALILTPFIEEGRIDEGRSASVVDPEMFLGVRSHSGYFTVNKTYNSNTFFWYFPVENKPVNTTPWIIWLQGGPGASSMTGLFDEIGPLSVDSNLKLGRNRYTWLKNHSLVFFDNPVGTGFSFTEDKRGFVVDMDTYTSHLFSAFHQFLEVFPELRSAPLYVAGESYAGKYVPALGVEIHRRLTNDPDFRVNLQGFMIGNAYVDPAVIPLTTRPYYNFGLIDQEHMDTLKPLVKSLETQIAANNSTGAKIKWMNLVSILLTISYQSHGYNFLNHRLEVGRYVRLLNQTKIQKAIHVRRTNFNFVNMTVNEYLAPDFLSSGKKHFETLLDHYRVLAYCGQLDLMMPCITTSENYRTWKWNEKNNFIEAPRLPYYYLNKRAGYYKTGGGLTEVVVLGAGHMVPLDVPAQSQDLITRWIHQKQLGPPIPNLDIHALSKFILNNTVVYL